MKRPQLVSNNALARLFQSADQARRRLDFQQCVEILERASRLDLGNPTLLLNLGHAYGKNFDFAKAESSFERALRLSPKKTEALAAAAMRAHDFGNAIMANQYYRLASEQKDATPDIFVALAENSERLSRLDEAAQFAGRALALKPNFSAARLVQARLTRQAGRLSEAEQILRSLSNDTPRDIRVKAGYELGSILDRQGRYDEAMAAFRDAKALLIPDAAPHIAAAHRVRGQLKELRDNLKAETLHRWQAGSKELAPMHRLALLCGHPRSGTTLLEQVLDSHPDIVSAEETTIFHDHAYPFLARNAPVDANVLAVLDSAPPSILQPARTNYFRCMDAFLGDSIGTRLLVDKNPILTFLLIPFIRIFPETKLLIALRDPRDVVLSCFMQPLSLNQSAAAFLTLEGAVDDYAELMAMYQTVAPLIPNERIEVRYEDMVSDLESVARRTLEFLGASWDKRVLHFHEHAQKKLVRSPTYADVTRPVFKRAVGRWRNYERYLEPYLAKLAPFAKAFGYDV
ncbi:MAG TPA: sulfotransferase [Candidatus Angelobacter sp.]|nr:sulfotransferase [Candidatus Angelobacter sp.]